MTQLITLPIVEAYSHCPRKAYLLRSDASGVPHEYTQIIAEREAANREAHRNRLPKTEGITQYSTDELKRGRNVLLDAVLTADGLEANCDALTRTRPSSKATGINYEPVRVIGTDRISRHQIIGLAYLGHVLGRLQQHIPQTGTIVRAGDRPCRVKFTNHYKEVRSIVATVRTWGEQRAVDPPPIILNKHCPECPFRATCREQAEKDGNLSLLDRMTPRLLRQYHEKGIFTIDQLSYVFRPRRSRRNATRPIRHSLELQALAIRTGKTYIEQMPDLPRHSVELFVDLEGVPDQGLYYLIGLLVCESGVVRYYSWWAGGKDEEQIWLAFIEKANEFPDAPVYHYGNYEQKAFKTLASRYGRGDGMAKRLVNAASFVYGKLYFPARSNGLKVLGRFLGATWTCSEASGLLSLVWRHQWEVTQNEQHQRDLLQYNREDCEAVRLLVEELRRISAKAESESTIDFAHRPKQNATHLGKETHRQFEQILRYAAEDGQGKSIRIRAKDIADANQPKKRGAQKGHQTYHRIIPEKAGRNLRVASKRRCPRHHIALVPDCEQMAERTVIDLAFTRNGCRKTVTKYVGKKAYCPRCDRHYEPPSLGKLHNQMFGHELQAWAIYQRIVLRLPYKIITQVMEHLFGIGLSTGTVLKFLSHLAAFYAGTEAALLEAIRASTFVHVDETRISIQGVDQYVWVFTDGKHVVFRMTETREADIVREVLSGFSGVLVTDFYPDYDAMPCRQQKCLVHLIRDLNEDLWKAPFDRELEVFALEFQSLLVPILETVDQYGLKAWHLRKFVRNVDRFYEKNIASGEPKSELVVKYQKRFQRYRDSLFVFLTLDGIPWNNNMGERAIRQLAIQRKISGSFFKRGAQRYLLLLAIAQTCRFQEKSFLKFLLSKETDVDRFRRTRPIKYSRPVGSPSKQDSE